MVSVELDLLAKLDRQNAWRRRYAERFYAYLDGEARIQHLGMAVPPSLRLFETVANWSQTVVDAYSERSQVRDFYMPGIKKPDKELRAVWHGNNLDADQHMVTIDRLTAGVGFVSVGSNEEDPGTPLITPESPLEVAVEVDARRRRLTAAAKFTQEPVFDGVGPPPPRLATLWLPDSTTWLVEDQGGWVVQDRDDHRVGRVMVEPFFNRRRTGQWHGRSELADVIPLVDGAARTLTNLQLGAESHIMPSRYAVGVTQGDFVDSDGNPVPKWEAYFTALMTAGSTDAKFGQFTPGDMKQFVEVVTLYGTLIASLKGLPVRYMGSVTTNPPSADGIRADESRLIRIVENLNAVEGDSWSRVMGMANRLVTGEWVSGARVATSYYDPATPTESAKGDKVMKLRSAGILSRKGAWAELGWSPERMEREEGYFAEEEALGPDALAAIGGLNQAAGDAGV